MQLNYHRIASINLLVGADTVVFGCSIPSDSVITSMRGEVHFIGEEINWKKAALYALDGYIIFPEDPDAGTGYDSAWERFVPKAIGWANGGLDLDTESSNSVSFYEPGQATVEDIMDLGSVPERVFKHRGFRTVANNPAGYNFVASDLSTYFPIAVIPINVKKQYRVHQHESMLLFAGASPLVTDVTVSQKAMVTERTWGYLKYTADYLHMAFLALTGEVETGAESPYEDIMNDLENELNPPIIEAVAGDFDDMVYQLFGHLTVQVTVPGNFNVSSLSLQS